MAELYIFSPDDELLTILTESNGLLTAPYHAQRNRIPDTPLTFTAEADTEYIQIYDGDNNLTQVASMFIGAVGVDARRVNVAPARFIKEENRVVFRDREGVYQEFVIKEIDDIDGINGPETTATCIPAFVDELSEHYVLDKRYTDKEAQLALNDALASTRYEGTVRVSLGLASTNFYKLSSLSCIWEIIKVWGGDIASTVELTNGRISKRKIIIKQRLGADNGLRVEIDHNIEEIQRTVLSYPVTALYGWGASLQTEGGGNTRYIDFADVVWTKKKGDPVDKPKGQKWVGDPQALSDLGRLKDGQRIHRFGEFSNQDYEDKEELLWATWQSLQQAKKPEVNYRLKVDLLDKKAQLGDGAIAIDREFARPIEIQTRIIAIEYDLVDIDGTTIVELGEFLNLRDDRLDSVINKVEKNEGKWSKPTIDNGSFPDIKPGTPVNVRAEGGFRTIQIYWDYSSEVYISHYEVYGSQVKAFVPSSATLLWRGDVSAFAHEVETDQTWYYCVRAVNTRGTAGEYSGRVKASTARIVSDDILFGSITADLLEDNLDIADKLAQNTIDSIKAPSNAYTDAELTTVRTNLETRLNDVDGTLVTVNADISELEGWKSSTITKLTNIDSQLSAQDTAIDQNATDVSLRAAEISNIDGRVTDAEGAINVNANDIALKVSKNGVIAGINISPEEILIAGKKIHLTGQTQIDEGIIGTAAIANLAVDRFHLKYGIIDNVHIEDATIEHTKMKSVNADKINVGVLRGIDIYGAKFRSSDGFSYMEIKGGNAVFTQNTGQYIKINPDGFWGYNGSGSTRFRVDDTLVTSRALGTTRSNVYLAPDSTNEVRVVDIKDVPSDGEISSYSYRPLRASGFYGNYIENNAGSEGANFYIRPRAGGEVRITGANTTDAYYPLRAGVIYSANFLTTTTSMWMGTDSAMHVVNKGFVENSSGTPIYRNVYAGRYYGAAFITSTRNAYIGTDNELKVVNKGLGDIFRNIRANIGYLNAVDHHGGGVNLYLRPSAGGEVRATKTGTTSSYLPVRADSFPTGSSEKFKDDIKKYTGNALQMLNDSVIYEYNRKTGHHELGFVIEREMPEVVKFDEESVNGYTHRSLNTKAIQELDKKTSDEINWLRIENQDLRNKIEKLEAKVA